MSIHHGKSPARGASSASSSFSPVELELLSPNVVCPQSLICSMASRLAPSPMEIMEMTATTWKTIPSVLSRVRACEQ